MFPALGSCIWEQQGRCSETIWSPRCGRLQDNTCNLPRRVGLRGLARSASLLAGSGTALKPCHCSATGFGTPSQKHRNSSLSDPVSWKELGNSNVIRTGVKESRNKSSNQRQEGKKIKTSTSTTAACPLNAPPAAASSRHHVLLPAASQARSDLSHPPPEDRRATHQHTTPDFPSSILFFSMS